MKTRMLPSILAAGIALAPHAAFAQEECPVAEIGQPCDAGMSGTCISATCSETADGSTTTRHCGACVMLPANSCTDAGQPCGDGGICSTFGAGGGGGSSNGQSSSMISYGLATCQYPGNANADDGAVRNADFADAALKGGEGTSMGAADASAASPHGGPAAAPSGSGCAITTRPVRTPTRLFGLALAALFVVRRGRRLSERGPET